MQTQIHATDARRWAENAKPTVTTYVRIYLTVQDPSEEYPGVSGDSTQDTSMHLSYVIGACVDGLATLRENSALRRHHD